ncbi:MAG: DUF4179 domain-containing protein, partial [Clostridia bacterium]
PGLENKPDFERDVLRQVRGEVKVKKKLSVGLVLVIVLVLAVVGMAVAITLNLFELYGQKDKRLADIAPSTMITPAVATVTDDNTAKSTISITNAYYDGNALLFSYTIENPTHYDDFAPTNEQLMQMEATASDFLFDTSNVGERTLEEEYRNAKRNGLAFGLVQSSVFLSVNTCSETGIDLGTWNEFNEFSEPARYSCIRDFDSLPEEACNLDSLRISTPIWQRKTYFYYDGKTAHTMETLVEMSSISAMVPRSPNEVFQYEGDAVYKGFQLHCIVEATNIHLSAAITVQGQTLPDLPEGCFYDMCLQALDGTFIEASGSEEQDGHLFIFTFNGTGKKPDIHTASLRIVGDEMGTEAIDIVLKEKDGSKTGA